ncbi:maleylpyruvate isomerase N-terminal domain-containing protein [Hamadaea sp. NPDC051192]|uniref:maleylpyruvate isomerase N-terminal domain-containing protein n=1 Tax=Hamadaea sp. NPDC051192 TaxID=3154940 RepID=UPI00341CC247
MSVRDDYLASAAVAAAFLAEPAVAARWAEPSALAKLSVGGLAGHLSRQIVVIPGVLAAPPSAAAPIDLVEHYTQVKWRGADLDEETNAGIRETGETAAEPGSAAINDDVAAALAELPGVVLGRSDGGVLVPWTGWTLTVDGFLTTRLLELIVHTDDLAVSVGAPTPEFPPSAVQTVVDLLSRLAVQRHGAVNVLRALSRAERAPATVAAI